MGEAIERSCGHLGAVEHGGAFAEGEVGGDDDRGALVEAADQVEQELPARLRERYIAGLVEHDEVEARQVVGHAALLPATGLGFEPVDQINDVEEAAAGPAAMKDPDVER